MKVSSHTTAKVVMIVALALVCATPPAGAGPYIFAGSGNGLDIITHVYGYNGAGGHLIVEVGIDPTSANAADMVIPTQNVIRVFNALQSTTANLVVGTTVGMTSSQFDFESVLIHEMGHALGLAHPNLASESGQVGDNQNYTQSERGANATFNLDDGADNIIGSADDVRGDDVNLYWFHSNTNNPIANPGTVDATTFTRNVASLPGADTFPANADRAVLADLGSADTESVMQQGTFNNEAQRTLTGEDIATLRLAMAGSDEVQGTGDDYTFELQYVGLTTSADIVIDFDNSTGFAVALTGGVFLGDHVVLNGTTDILFNSGFDWFFNQTPNDSLDTVFVDFTAASNGDGSSGSPFDNLTDALAAVAADGTIEIAPGTSSETFTGVDEIDQSVTLNNSNSAGGPVVIGELP